MAKRTGIDRLVGGRISARREALGLSRQQLADHLGISSRDIEIYETGKASVSVVRLQALARIFSVGLEYFFEVPKKPRTLHADDVMTRVLHDPDTMRLNKAFCRIKDVKLRKAVISFIKAVSTMDHDGSGDLVVLPPIL